MKKFFLSAWLVIILMLYPTLLRGEVHASDTLRLYSDEEVTELLRNMPNIEVGKGVTFKSKDNRYKMTMRLRLQSMVGISLDDAMGVNETEACIKRLHMRFDGYVFTPKVAYSIQLGYTPYDTKGMPDGGGLNIIRDAMIYYVPSPMWSIGLGQTKLRGGRANINSSSALQFVDRSIVNSQFHIDRDFGLFAEYHNHIGKQFNYAIKGSITTGDGRNYYVSQQSGLAYTIRGELYPLGQFTSRGEVSEGDFVRESSPRLAIGGAFSYNDRACRVQGTKGKILIDDNRRSLQSWFADVIFKYQGWAFYTDVMGRLCNAPDVYNSDGSVAQHVYTGWGINVQASYLFTKNWELAIRHSSLLPDKGTAAYEGYDSDNQATLAVTKYFIGHNLKIHADFSYNYATGATVGTLRNDRWQARLSVDVGI